MHAEEGALKNASQDEADTHAHEPAASENVVIAALEEDYLALQRLFERQSELISNLSQLFRSAAADYSHAIAAKQAQLEAAKAEAYTLLGAAERLERQARCSSESHHQLVSQATKPITQESTPQPAVGVRGRAAWAEEEAVLHQPRRTAAQKALSHSERRLTLKQMKELIEEVYASKEKHDARCEENALPRETLQQHLFTYLNTRYGLKSLIAENARACADGVQRYSAVDNDVAVFGAILKNEVDEEFSLVQRQLKQTVTELLRVHLKGKFKFKRPAEIQRMLESKMAGQINQEEWVDIVEYMYAPADASLLTSRIKERAQTHLKGTQSNVSVSARGAQQPRPHPLSLPFQSFLQVLLDFQLAGHRHFLRHFVTLFRACDTQCSGVLDEDSFIQLVQAVAPEKDEMQISQLLATIDPHGHGKMTFSDCVATLSKELVAVLN